MIIENDNKTTQRKQLAFSSIGKLPPQDCDMEEAVLGALMIESDALMLVADFLIPEMFYKDNHQKVYNAIKTLFINNSPVDLMTVRSQLQKFGELEMIGGAYALTELTDRVSSAANIEYHARMIVQKFIQRELIRVSTGIINDAYEDTTDVFELLEKAEKGMFEVISNRGTKHAEKMSNILTERIKEYRKPVINGLTGIPTGLSDVDRISHGWQKTDLIIIAARPSMGKTAFALHCAKHPSLLLGLPTAIFSLEMSSLQLTDRIISSETEIHLEKFLTHNLTEPDFLKVEEVAKMMNDSNLFIDDTAGLNVFEFRAKCRRLKAKHDIQLIIVDYLQLMSGKDNKSNNREQEISSISRCLKSVAKELNVPVIALSQLSRTVETRPGGGKRPMLSDLRESGSIEQDADVVLFLYRDEYYGITQDANGKSTIGKVEVIFAKNRNGKTDVACVDFNGAKMKFRDWDYLVKMQASMGFVPINDTDKPSNFVIRPNNLSDDDHPF